MVCVIGLWIMRVKLSYVLPFSSGLVVSGKVWHFLLGELSKGLQCSEACENWLNHCRRNTYNMLANKGERHTQIDLF